jgi:hypothetical protein
VESTSTDKARLMCKACLIDHVLQLSLSGILP